MATRYVRVGCPYVVRGFDYDWVGLLWLDDLVWRDGRWKVNLSSVHETAWSKTRKAAKDEAKKGVLGPGTDALIERLASRDTGFCSAGRSRACTSGLRMRRHGITFCRCSREMVMGTDVDTTLQELREAAIAFRDERDWKQFHEPKDLALALGVDGKRAR